jgi:hypothetical protein
VHGLPAARAGRGIHSARHRYARPISVSTPSTS